MTRSIDLIIKKQRLIDIVTNNPQKYSLEDLHRIIKLSPPVVKSTVDENNLTDLIKPRNHTK